MLARLPEYAKFPGDGRPFHRDKVDTVYLNRRFRAVRRTWTRIFRSVLEAHRPAEIERNMLRDRRMQRKTACEENREHQE